MCSINVFTVIDPRRPEPIVEVPAAQIALAPLSTLIATRSLVDQAWEMMGLRVHW